MNTTHTEDSQAVAGQVQRPVRPLSARLDVLRVLLAARHPEHHATVADAQAEIERAWAERDAAVSNLEAHTEAEVRRAVAADRERWNALAQEIDYGINHGWPQETLTRLQGMRNAMLARGPNGRIDLEPTR